MSDTDLKSMAMIPDDVRTAFKGRSALVTGGAGLIGRQVVRLLCELGASVQSVSLDDISTDNRARAIKGDLRDPAFCDDITRDMDYVFHVAGIKGAVSVTKDKPASMFVPLLQMNTNVLESARKNGAGRILYTSTIGAYGPADEFREDDDDPLQPPMDVFPGWAKRMGEMQVAAYRQQYGMDNFAVVRPSNIYGPGDNFDPETSMVVPALIARAVGGENPLSVWGDGSAIRDIAYSADIAAGMILAIHHGTRDSFVNLGAGQRYSIRDVVEALADIMGIAYEFDTSKPTGYPIRIMDISRARDWLGYAPQVSLKEGLRATHDWYLENSTEYERRKNFFKEA